MAEEKEKQKEPNNFTGSNCVIRDDDHSWGGPDPEENKPVEKKILKPERNDPINWPFKRYR